MRYDISLQTEFATVAYLAEGQYLKDGLTLNKEKFQRFYVGTLKTNDDHGRGTGFRIQTT